MSRAAAQRTGDGKGEFQQCRPRSAGFQDGAEQDEHQDDLPDHRHRAAEDAIGGVPEFL